MASWKKVIVSGSSAELAQLAVDTHITASGNISSSGTIIASDLTLSGDISVTNITASVVSASTSLVAGTAKVSDLTDNQVVIAGTGGELEGDANLTFDANTLSGASLKISALDITGSAISASTSLIAGTISATNITGSIISASSELIAGTIVNASAVGSSHLTGSFTGSFKGTFTNSDGTALTAEWDGTRDGNSQITGSGTGPSLVLSGSTGDDLVVKKNAKVEGKILATDFDTIASGDVILFDTVGDSSLTIGATDTTVKLVGDLIELGDGVGDVVDIKGNLQVAGTASFNHATNLSVADKYILLNSGSAAAGDGGIVIQQATNGKGELFGFDSSANRFGITGSFNADTSADFTPDAFMSMVVSGSGASSNDPDSAPAKYKVAGNIFAAEDGNIYIYGNA